ncbi:hypothetical protein J3D55_004229 [Chryseobacterium ginsenosidimutans]|nr:hypothetical protein [Chryseobacterium ginsenosidimutans]
MVNYFTFFQTCDNPDLLYRLASKDYSLIKIYNFPTP